MRLKEERKKGCDSVPLSVALLSTCPVTQNSLHRTLTRRCSKCRELLIHLIWSNIYYICKLPSLLHKKINFCTLYFGEPSQRKNTFTVENLNSTTKWLTHYLGDYVADEWTLQTLRISAFHTDTIKVEIWWENQRCTFGDTTQHVDLPETWC